MVAHNLDWTTDPSNLSAIRNDEEAFKMIENIMGGAVQQSVGQKFDW